MKAPWEIKKELLLLKEKLPFFRQMAKEETEDIWAEFWKANIEETEVKISNLTWVIK